MFNGHFTTGYVSTACRPKHLVLQQYYMQRRRQLWGTGARAPLPSTFNDFIFSSLWNKSDSQLSKYCVVCEISWCRCQQLTALSISTALVTKLLVIEQLLHLALKSTVSAPWHNFQLCPSLQQILATPLIHCPTTAWRMYRKQVHALVWPNIATFASERNYCGGCRHGDVWLLELFVSGHFVAAAG